MTSDLRVVYDATGANLDKITIPAGVGAALYTTGSSGVPASAAQLAAHPGAVQIDQSPVNTALDELADVLDYENGAATLADLGPWYVAAFANFAKSVGPGQRHPAIYVQQSNVTAVANELTAAGIKAGPGLWVASWDLPIVTAIDMLITSGGPFPVIGVQVHNAGLYDVSLFLTSWLDDVSKAAAPAPHSGVQGGWRWCPRCEGLFFGPNYATSHCPAGGQHSLSGSSFDYELSWSLP